MNVKTQMRDLGLEQKEIDVYLSLLKKGSSTAFQIAKEVRLPASSVRDVLQTLSKKGIVSRYKTKNRFVYSPTNPSLLRDRAEKQLEVATDLVPKLNDLYHSAGKMASVRYFDNKSGFDVFFKEVLNEADAILMTGSDVAHVFLPEYFPKFTQRRVKKGIPAKLLLPKTELSQGIRKKDQEELRVTRFVKSEKDIPSSIFLWKDKVAIFSIEENPTILLIEDKNMAQVFRMLYENLWECLE